MGLGNPQRTQASFSSEQEHRSGVHENMAMCLNSID